MSRNLVACSKCYKSSKRSWNKRQRNDDDCDNDASTRLSNCRLHSTKTILSNVATTSTKISRMPSMSYSFSSSSSSVSASHSLSVWSRFQLLLVAAVAGIVAGGGGEATWNVTCPKQCSCHIQPSEFSHSTTLKAINCSSQNIRSVPSNFPKDTEALLMPGNDLSDLYDHVPDLLDLKELDVSNNQIRSLGRGYIFHNLSVLTYLNLAKNELTSLVRDVFVGLSNLQFLILSENKISYVEDQAFQGLSSLLILDLSRNQLASLYSEWFFGLARLNELYAYENRIHGVSSATFRPLRRLQHLSLHGNRISHVSNDGFWGLDVLETLHLERNSLKEVPTKALQSLVSLRYLYLTGNPFPRLRTGDVADLTVEELSLNNLPSLTLVDSAAFSNLTRLTVLEIKDCPKLAYFDQDAFVNVTVLHSLMLQNNHLLSLPREIAKSLPDGVEISLRDNPLLCDCNIRWIRQEMELTEQNNSRVKFLDSDKILCDTPEHIRGTRVRHLDPTTALKPQCPPSILPLLDKVIEKRLGEQLLLDCRGVGNPTPKLRWVLPNGRTLEVGDQPSNDVRVQLKRTGTLYFYHLKEEDHGNYTCVAENTLGQSEMHVSVNVKRVDINIFPIVVSSNFVTVVWNGTARKIFQQLEILYREISSSLQVSAKLTESDNNNNNNNYSSYKQVTVRSAQRDYTISNLLPESTYEFCIAFKDSGGYYVRLACTMVRTRDADYMFRGIHRTSNVAVAIILAIIVVMVMVVCCITVTARKYRQRQYVCPDKYVAHRMSHIPLENLYSPLMSNAAN